MNLILIILILLLLFGGGGGYYYGGPMVGSGIGGVLLIHPSCLSPRGKARLGPADSESAVCFVPASATG